MSDGNGKPVSLRDVVDVALGRVFVDDGTLLRDLVSEQPNIRLFLIGGQRNGQTWPAGEVRIVLLGNTISVTLAVRSLEIEAKYHDKSCSTLVDAIENDLALDTVRWVPDWQGRKRLERKLLT